MTAVNRPSSEKKKRCPNPKCGRIYEASDMVCREDGTILAPLVDSLVGSILDSKYEILSEIGRGGMSIVFKANHQHMDRIVAIKVLQSQLISDQTSTKRFRQEAQAASLLKHANVIGVHDYGIAESTKQPYIVMDHLVGESLSDVIKRNNHVDEKKAVKIFLQACDALEHAHKKGVLHRDLKASNIMLVDEDGKTDIVKVVDFGIAKFMPASGKQPQNLTQTGEIFGSPIYMSPEQCLGETLDVRSDIYSMGVLMYEAITGVPPLMGETIIDTMKMHVEKKPGSFAQVRPDLKISKDLEAAVFKALEKQAAARFQSMQEFFNALEIIAFSLGVNDAEGRQANLADSLARLGKLSGSVPTLDYQSNRPTAVADRPYSVSRFGTKTADRLNNPSARESLVDDRQNGVNKRSIDRQDQNEDDQIGLLKDKRVIAGIVVFILALASILAFLIGQR